MCIFAFLCVWVLVWVWGEGEGRWVGVREKMRTLNRYLKKSEKVGVIKDGMGEW